ncbi:hypothetical protein D3C87_1999300 [compost metagenome]
MTAGRVGKHFIQPQLLNEQRRQAVIPIVEIPCDQNGLTVRHHTPDPLGQRQHLARAAAGKQAQMHHKAMHRAVAHVDARVQQAALL